jgi:hypothetical protein
LLLIGLRRGGHTKVGQTRVIEISLHGINGSQLHSQILM